MKNKEKYMDELLDCFVRTENFCDFTRRYVHKGACQFIGCPRCADLKAEWLEQEYTEPPFDWSKVAVDTKVKVSSNNVDWINKHFATYEDNRIYCFDCGNTSWTSRRITAWEYVRLAEDEQAKGK